MRHHTRLIVYAVLLALGLYGVIAAAMYGLTEYYRPAKDITVAKADLTVNASELFAAFEKNEKEANEKYLNKIIAVKGPVGEISTDQSNQKVVVLRTPDMMFGIACSMAPSDAAKVAKLKDGQEVTVKGLCTGYTMDVVLTDGSLVD